MSVFYDVSVCVCVCLGVRQALNRGAAADKNRSRLTWKMVKITVITMITAA